MQTFKHICVLFLMLWLPACATLSPNYEQPQVNITSFSLAPNFTGNMPQFLIGIQIINPNRNELSLDGMSYSVEVEKQRILSGAEANLPDVPGYGMTEFTITTSPDLVGSARLINQLLSSPQKQLAYLFKAKLDVGRLLPFVSIEEAGQFNLATQ